MKETEAHVFIINKGNDLYRLIRREKTPYLPIERCLYV